MLDTEKFLCNDEGRVVFDKERTFVCRVGPEGEWNFRRPRFVSYAQTALHSINPTSLYSAVHLTKNGIHATDEYVRLID